MSDRERFHLECEVLRNEPVSSRYWLMALRAPQIVAAARPGQFVQLRPFRKAGPRGYITDPLLPRPFALYGAGDEKAGGESIEVLYFVVGRGTRIMSELRPGERATVLGPLGVPFSAPDDAGVLVAIGGGTGLAPLRYLFAEQARACSQLRTAHIESAVFEARSRDVLAELAGRRGRAKRHLVLGAREASIHLSDTVLDLPDTHVSLATDDGSGGFHGTAVDLASRVLDGIDGSVGPIQVYAAGPVPMMHAAWKLADRRGLPCQVSLEALMACGVGVCRSCVVDGRTPHPETGLFRRTMCVEGPVFDAAELDWSTVVRV